MWFDEAGEVVEMFRSSFPLSILFFVPICILISPIGPAAAAHDFAVYRMQQYDLQGTPFGCRNTLVNVEARAIDGGSLTRKCVIARLQQLTTERYRDLISQNAGALLVLLPKSLTELSTADQEHLLELERDLLQEETQVPVYFAEETAEISEIYEEVQSAVSSDSADSAAAALFSTASANGFQMTINSAQSKALNDFQVVNIQGKLSGYGIEEQLPTIAIVAHYDAFGIAPGMAYGADSNGSGVAALLQLARLFSKLYSNSRTHAKFNLLFLLSGAGKFNYQGTKRWIEDQLDTGETSLLSEVSYVLCLDSLAAGDSLFLHVSKPPKEGSLGHTLQTGMEEVSASLFADHPFSVVRKKINLADNFLAWEHERFSIRRLPAFTLSHFESHSDPRRKSVLDTKTAVDIDALSRNTKIVAEALARQIFNLTTDGASEIFANGMSVEPEILAAWIDYLGSEPRAAQLLDKDNGIVIALHQSFTRHLKDVKKLLFKADKRDPEFVFYDGAQHVMNAYNVKPAVFDLFLALGIAAYLGLLFLIAQHFGFIYSTVRSVFAPLKSKAA